MLTLNLSFKSLPFLSTKFERCELPISPLISFRSLTPSKCCLNSILCCVFICYHHHLVIHRSCLDTHLYSYSKKSHLFHLKLRMVVYLSSPWTCPLLFSLAHPVLTPPSVVFISLVLIPIYLLSYTLFRYHL
jgi:hypothetical protein